MSNLKKFAINIISRLIWTIAPGMATTIIAKAFFTSRSNHINANQQELLDKAEPFQVSALDKTVQCWKWGSGPSVLLVHGWGARGIILAPLIPPLMDSGFSVVTYDSLAHGESEGEITHFFEFIETVNSVSRHIGNADFVIAHSMGAAAAMNLEGAANKNIKFVFIAPLYDVYGAIYSFAISLGLYLPLYDKIIKNIEKKFGKTLHDVSPVAFANRFTAPVLIFHDEHDKTVSIKQGERLAESLADARLVKTSGLGHNQILESRDLMEITLEFFGNVE